MKEKYLPNKKYYTFSTECYCAVVVGEKTMKRIQKVLYKAEAEIKTFFIRLTMYGHMIGLW